MRDTHFDNQSLDALGIEWMTVSELRRRVPLAELLAPERLDFYMLLLVTGGAGTHMVDFVEGALRPGSLVFVRPGQVQQWRSAARLEGAFVLVTAPVLFPPTARASGPQDDWLPVHEWPAISQLPGMVEAEIAQAMERLQGDFERYDHTALDAALIRHAVLGLLMRVGRWMASGLGSAGTGLDDRAVYRLFLRELEASFRQRLGVRDYAARLGYSQSTLARACKAAEGRSAKLVIDRRIALEAARELVHSQASVAEIGHHLGFSEATNFVKFFGRLNGLSPHAFRQKMALP